MRLVLPARQRSSNTEVLALTGTLDCVLAWRGERRIDRDRGTRPRAISRAYMTTNRSPSGIFTPAISVAALRRGKDPAPVTRGAVPLRIMFGISDGNLR